MIKFAVEKFAACYLESKPLQEAHWAETEGFRKSNMNVDYVKRLKEEEAGNYLYCTARTDLGLLVGHCAWWRRYDHYESRHFAAEDVIFILEEHRGGGVGRELWTFAEDQLIARGVDDFRLAVPEGKLKFWLSAGYEVTTVNVVKRLTKGPEGAKNV